MATGICCCHSLNVATRGYAPPRWPDWRAWAETKPRNGVHKACATPTTRCALRLRPCWSTTIRVAIAGCSSWRSTTRSRRLRNWRASSRPIAATTCCGSSGAEAPASRQPGPGAGATSRSATGLVRCVVAGAAGKPPSFAPCGCLAVAPRRSGCHGSRRPAGRGTRLGQRRAGAGPQHAFPAAPHRNAPQQVSWLLRRARDDD